MATAPIGHNAPPDPFEAFKLDLESLFDEAGNFLDGEPIANQKQADSVSVLVNRLRKSIAAADKARKEEKRPHDEAAAAVQTKWLPIIDKAGIALSASKSALSAYLSLEAERQRAAAQALQEEANRQAEAAAQAASQARPDDLAGQVTARTLQENAAATQKAADRASKAPVQAKGGERAVSLRSRWTATVADPVAFARWAWEHRRGDYLTFLETLANAEARHGPRDIPGLTMNEQRNAV